MAEPYKEEPQLIDGETAIALDHPYARLDDPRFRLDNTFGGFVEEDQEDATP